MVQGKFANWFSDELFCQNKIDFRLTQFNCLFGTSFDPKLFADFLKANHAPNLTAELKDFGCVSMPSLLKLNIPFLQTSRRYHIPILRSCCP